MKPQKIVAMIILTAMAMGVAAGCDSSVTPTETADTTETSATEPSEQSQQSETTPSSAESSETEPGATETVPDGFREVDIAYNLTDEDEEVVVFCFDDTFGDLLSTYSDVANIRTVVPESGTYRDTLDRVLASGDEAPDLFLLDASYANDYFVDDSRTLPVNSLGISYSELTGMFNYTLQLAESDDNVIKGLTWQATPCAVFYNRGIAEELLGVSDPSDIAPMFSDWDTFLSTAGTINEASNGEKKIISGLDDIWRNYTASRTGGWITGGRLYMDPVMTGYFDLAKTLTNEGLTFGTTQWDDNWLNGYNNGTVFSYFIPLWIADLYLNTPAPTDGDPYAGNWGVVRAPSDCYWGGTWIAASTYCNSRASAASIMRDITMDQTNLEDMARNGIFVNNRSVMGTISEDASEARDWLGGQNPAVLLLEVANSIDTSLVCDSERQINEEYMNIVSSYVAGDIESTEEAREIFESNIAELGII